MGFLDELKQLAEKRISHSDGLLMDTLKKRVVKCKDNENASDCGGDSSGIEPAALKPVKQFVHPDNEKRRQHGKCVLIII